jgi:hypothetical protein
VEWLIEAAKQNRSGHRDATAILVAYRHGLRASLVALRWEEGLDASDVCSPASIVARRSLVVLIPVSDCPPRGSFNGSDRRSPSSLRWRNFDPVITEAFARDVVYSNAIMG